MISIGPVLSPNFVNRSQTKSQRQRENFRRIFSDRILRARETREMQRDVSSCNTYNYGDAHYWDARYVQDALSFDWYQRYSSLRPFVRNFIPTSSRVLMVGCGNSRKYFSPSSYHWLKLTFECSKLKPFELFFWCSYVRGYGQGRIRGHNERWHIFSGYWDDANQICFCSSAQMYNILNI